MNQGTPAESDLPKIVYFGSSSSNDKAPIYYSYDTASDFRTQQNFQTFSNLWVDFNINNVYSVFQHQGSLYLATDGNSGNLIILDSNSFATSNLGTKRTNNLTTAYSYVIIDNFSFSVTTTSQNQNIFNNSGTLTTTFLTLSNTTNTIISSSNNILYRNNYAINPVGAHIEFRDPLSNFSIYPIYIGSLSDFNNGWWDKTSTKNVSAFIIEPGYKILVYENPNYTPPLICSVVNSTLNPIYSIVYNITKPYSNASYILTSLS